MALSLPVLTVLGASQWAIAALVLDPPRKEKDALLASKRRIRKPNHPERE